MPGQSPHSGQRPRSGQESRWGLPAILMLLCLGIPTGIAAAQDSAAAPVDTAAAARAQEQARLHFESGASYYEAGNYDDALREWNRAYELSQRAALFYNMSLAYQGLGDFENAVTYLRRYLAGVAEVPNRANLQLRVQNLQERVDAAAANTETPAEPQTPASPQTPSGPNAPQQGHNPAPAGGGGLNIGAIAGFSAAGAGVVMVGLFGALTLAEDSSLSGDCSPGCSASEVSSLQTFALLTDIGLGLAIAGAATGVVFLLIGGDEDSDSEQAHLTPLVTPNAGGLMLEGSF